MSLAQALTSPADYLDQVTGTNVSYYINDYWDDGADHRFTPLPLMKGGPWRLYAILASYLTFVLYLGPRLMKDRAPFDLRIVLRFYNFFLVISNAYLFYEASMQTTFSYVMWGCPDPYWPLSPYEIKLVWFSFSLRLIELLDTIFFVLRKKQNQVSFLHVFHHCIVPTVGWHGLKYATHPALAFAPYLNTFVHIIMFTYYGLATFKSPTIQKHLWWKKHLTKLQLVQFILMFIHGLQPFIFRSCPYPSLYKIQGILSTTFFFLFLSFYINAYSKRKSKERAAANEAKMD